MAQLSWSKSFILNGFTRNLFFEKNSNIQDFLVPTLFPRKTPRNSTHRKSFCRFIVIGEKINYGSQRNNTQNVFPFPKNAIRSLERSL